MKSRWTQAHREAEGLITGEPGVWVSSVPLKASSRPPPSVPTPHADLLTGLVALFGYRLRAPRRRGPTRVHPCVGPVSRRRWCWMRSVCE